MINKTIQVNQYAVTVKELDSLKESYTFIASSGLDTYYGVDALLVDGKLYAEFGIEKAKLTLLTNDVDLKFKRVATKAIELAFGEGIKIPEVLEQMPEFGVTIDGNINVQQFNIKAEDIDCVFRNMIVFWDIEGNLNANSQKFTAEDVVEYANHILEKGYFAPVVCYVDRHLKVIDYHNIPYLIKLLGLEALPVRLVSYKDIKYLEQICPILYEAIKKIPANKHYQRFDSEDCVEHIIFDYGDKRRLLQTYEKKKPIPEDTVINNIHVSYRPTEWSDYVPVYYFLFNDNYAMRNNALVAAINRGSYFGRQERADGKIGTSSLGGTLKAHLRGYDEFMAEEIQEDTTPSLDGYEECEDDKNLNALSADLLRFNYKLKEMVESEKIAEAVEADIAVVVDKVYPINLHNIHQHLQKDEIVIKFYTPK